MGNVPGVKEVDGKLVATARDIEPPTGWTTDFETLGGEEVWGSRGTIYGVLGMAGINAVAKPLYVPEPYTGASIVIMEAGSPATFYLYNPLDDSLFQITEPSDLAKIVEQIDDEDKGIKSLETQQIL
ncbi:uncharacterized protein N7511_010598 [Penicillium nucicola]|uniref:uncharacterized protein n=1 Tax=Penicillium nucicola TaxID=1850975 RepID=UPI0025454757|nr:uncharacterized protein N7511_010598 [Penicillium nucicola]KAJ5748902.1 hypothetical protein N7511_010598 [Penicillium nucicola]